MVAVLRSSLLVLAVAACSSASLGSVGCTEAVPLDEPDAPVGSDALGDVDSGGFPTDTPAPPADGQADTPDASDGAGNEDIGAPDASRPADAAPPEDSSRAGDADVRIADVDTPCEGCFGAPCASADDCDSWWCVAGPDGDICTSLCEVDCPAGFSCRQVATPSGDPVFLCLYDHAQYCRPCNVDSECAPPGVQTSLNRCLSLGGSEGGSFCATACSFDDDCPEGGECVEVDGPGTQGTCRPTGGVCECSVLAIASGAYTNCSNSNEFGACDGTRVCSELGLSECDAEVPSAESCDALDDDCDGATDEGLTQACDTVCGPGVEFCDGGVWFECSAPQPIPCLDYDTCELADACGDACPLAPDEVCNGVDDDCDGATDEGWPELGTPCDGDDADACLGGTFVCNGLVAVCDDSGETSAELCNGVDDDCDGATDEDFSSLGSPCDGPDADFCADGLWSCDGVAAVCDDDSASALEVCNDQDDDCDGATDEGFPLKGTPCDGDDLDVCPDGEWVCDGGGLVCDDDAAPAQEVCNGVDDDCDGVTDEGFPLLGQPCDGPDKDQCEDGVYVCDGTGAVCGDDAASTLEQCNGFDDDCDGATDEGWPELGQPCDGADSDLCADGQFVCAGVGTVCDDDLASTGELCNLTLDDDCDGLTDEGFSGDASNGDVDYPNAWSTTIPQEGTYPAQGFGNLTGRIKPAGDADWFTVEATEDLSDFCITDGQDEDIKGSVSLTAPPSVSYEVCACWSSAGAKCGLAGEKCATSSGGATATVQVNMDMNCGSDDFGYLDVVIRGTSPSTQSCEAWSATWSVWEDD